MQRKNSKGPQGWPLPLLYTGFEEEGEEEERVMLGGSSHLQQGDEIRMVAEWTTREHCCATGLQGHGDGRSCFHLQRMPRNEFPLQI